MKKLEIALIRTNGGTQARAELDNELIGEYKEAWIDGAKFPPLDVFFDGATYWLADGFHRLFGAKEAGKIDISVTIHDGTLRDAIYFAVGANKTNGLRRSNKDKRKAVALLLNDEEWVKMSDRAIAEHAGVGHSFVSKFRDELSTVDSSPAAKAKDEPRKGKDGKARKLPQPKTTKEKVERQRNPRTECLQGGLHEFEDGACKKCHEPKFTPKISGGATFNVAEIEAAQAAEEAAKPQNPQEQMDATNERFDAILNHLKQAKTIATKLASEQVTGAWLLERWSSAKVELDNLWTTFSALKPGMLCPRCKGTRCDYCKGTGHMTASFARQRKGA